MHDRGDFAAEDQEGVGEVECGQALVQAMAGLVPHQQFVAGVGQAVEDPGLVFAVGGEAG